MADSGMRDAVSLGTARKALHANVKELRKNGPSVMLNQTEALLFICDAVGQLQRDMDLLHRKMQPILKYLEEENADWRLRYPNYEE